MKDRMPAMIPAKQDIDDRIMKALVAFQYADNSYMREKQQKEDKLVRELVFMSLLFVKKKKKALIVKKCSTDVVKCSLGAPNKLIIQCILEKH